MPLNPEAELRNSFTTVPGAPSYDDIVAENGSADVRRGRHRGRHGAARGGRRHDADRRALPVRRQQPAAGQRVRADPRLGGAGRLQRHRRQQPDAGARTARTPTLYDASLFGWQSTADRRRRHRGATTSPAARTTTAGTRTTTVDALYERAQGEHGSRPSSRSCCCEIEQKLVGRRLRRRPSSSSRRSLAYNSTYVSGVDDHPAVADDVLELLGVGSGLIGTDAPRIAQGPVLHVVIRCRPSAGHRQPVVTRSTPSREPGVRWPRSSSAGWSPRSSSSSARRSSSTC